MGHFQFQLQHVKVIIPIFLKELCRDTVDTQNHLFKLYNLVICDMFTDMHNHHHSKFQNYFYHSKKKNSLSFSCHTHNSLDFIPATPHSGAVVKNLPANAGNTGEVGSIPGWGRSPGEGHGTPLQYSCLENPMDRGAWWATVCGVSDSQTRHAHTHTHTHTHATQPVPLAMSNH